MFGINQQKKLQQIPINPISGDYLENGIVYWFKIHRKMLSLVKTK